MKAIPVLLVAMLFLSVGSPAQNWKTVPLNSVNYFSAGMHNTGWYGTRMGGPFDSGGLLRCGVIESHSVNGADTTFDFPRTLRDTFSVVGSTYVACVDTTGPSWLGSEFIRKVDGREHYFNCLGDTITIQTAAGLGMSWNIARDVAGLVFKGTVVSMDTATIDAALDSIKTISIQAYSGTTPVSHWYNQCQLVLSKDHGFIKALEFFIFPNAIAGPDRTGAPFDKTQHLRLPADVMDGAVTLADLNWRYAPGNEWIFWDDNGINPDGSSRSVKVTHDSVLQTNPLTSGSLQVTIKSVHYEKQRIFEAPTSSKPYISYLVSDTSYQLVHTDTISTFSIGLPVYPEVGWRAALKNRYFVRQFCAGKYEVAIRFVDRYYPSFSNPACHRLLGDLSGPEYSRSYQDVLTGFGLTKQFTNALSANGETYHYVRPVYMKLGNCTRGSKINVATLSTGEVNRASAAFTVYPNPANDKLIITTNQPDQRQHVALRSIAGQLVYQQNFTGSSLNIYTADIPAGLYFLEVNGKAVRQTFKVLIQH